MNYHQNEKIFRDALLHTQAVTGFTAKLIEKDYYCSVLLQDFACLFANGMIFKGGTCLSKVHMDFYRLSEDLDFAFSISSKASALQRREQIKPVKEHVLTIPDRLFCFRVHEEIRGFDSSRHYTVCYAYRSVLDSQTQRIKVEFSLREENEEPLEQLEAKTLLQNPLNNDQVIKFFFVYSLSMREIYAEKIRAALTRREPAIRDFYDLYIAVHTGKLQFEDKNFLRILKKKLMIGKNSHSDTSNSRFVQLQQQIESHLKPVLREKDYKKFNLEQIFNLLSELNKQLRLL